MKNICKYFGFRFAKMWIIVVGMRTGVNNPIHVKVQIVEFWDL